MLQARGFTGERSSPVMFYGKYIKVRGCLDYTFHKFYSKERQLFQDGIIASFLDDKKTFSSAKLYLTAGAMGAGKTHTIRNLLGSDFSSYVLADVDRVKHCFPEMKSLLKSDPLNAGQILHSEACTVHEIIFRTAIHKGNNVIIDSSLRNGEFFKHFLTDLTAKGNYEVIIVHVLAPLELCLDRAKKREKETGRHVPRESIEKSVLQCPKSVELLTPLVNKVITIVL